jgi:molybdopterin/thiamine biosynthesis adenylyltransferase
MTFERYQRHSLIDWFAQDLVQTAKVAIIGCGAVGNEVAKNLALLGVGSIDLYDFDTIEIHNLTRSVLFREHDVGKNKAEVAAMRIQKLDPNIKVNYFAGDFWDLLPLDKAQNYNCILCCVDNFEARIKLNQICTLTRTNLINTGIDSKFTQVEVFPFANNKQVACYQCNLPNTVYERMQARYSCGWLKKIAVTEKKIPTTIITSSLAAAMATSKALALINGNEFTKAESILINSATGVSSISNFEQNNCCIGCHTTKKHIFITKSSANITSKFNFADNAKAEVNTSDPILVSYRCVKCNPNTNDCTVVFKKADDFDASLTTCKQCNHDSVDVVIQDSFTTHELINNYAGKKIPAKFLRLENQQQTTIIELE